MIKGKNMKPVLAITMGDPSGIGPEIAVKLMSEGRIYEQCKPLIIGNAVIIAMAVELTKSKLSVRAITDISKARFSQDEIDVIDLSVEKPGEIIFGKVSAESGDIAFRSIKKGIEMAIANEVDGIVTCPVNKESINKAGYQFAGHTEIFAHYTNTPEYGMLLADDKIKVIHVSTHVSLRQACNMVKKERVLDVINMLNRGLLHLGIKKPRIGVAGLNPHSSDGGLFGMEEEKEIIPAVRQAQQSGINVRGPVPPDTLFAMAKGGHFDGCVAMYHDQGHIPFKLLGFEWDEESKTMKSVRGVNITLGLPIIRTSVDHGTAFEIAGKGIASPDALIDAVEYAVKMHMNM